jgi:hypothetical protein
MNGSLPAETLAKAEGFSHREGLHRCCVAFEELNVGQSPKPCKGYCMPLGLKRRLDNVCSAPTKEVEITSAHQFRPAWRKPKSSKVVTLRLKQTKGHGWPLLRLGTSVRWPLSSSVVMWFRALGFRAPNPDVKAFT